MATDMILICFSLYGMPILPIIYFPYSCNNSLSFETFSVSSTIMPITATLVSIKLLSIKKPYPKVRQMNENGLFSRCYAHTFRVRIKRNFPAGSIYKLILIILDKTSYDFRRILCRCFTEFTEIGRRTAVGIIGKSSDCGKGNIVYITSLCDRAAFHIA